MALWSVSPVRYLVRLTAISLRCKSTSQANILRSPFSDVDIPDLTIPQFVWKDVNKWPDLTALTCGLTGRNYSYKESRDLSRRIAAVLGGASGFRPGQTIATLSPNTPEYPLIMMAALEAGLVVSPINPLYTVDEIVNQMRDSGCAGIVTYPDKLEAVLEARKKLRAYNRHQSETLRVLLAPGVLESLTPADSLPQDVLHLTELAGEVTDAEDLELNMSATIGGQDLAVLPYSSGTTGLPKGVCLTHTNIVANLQQIAHPDLRNIRSPLEGEQEVIPLLLPLYHIYGLVIIALQGLRYGAKLVTLPKFEEKTFLNSLKEHKATTLFVAPPLILYLGTSDNVKEEHLEHLKTTISGAAPVGESDIEKCLSKSTKQNVYKQGYGLTECSPGVFIIDNKGNTNYSSVGKIIPNTQVKIIDLTTGEALPPNKNGEICVKGPQVMKGYLNNPEATEETLDKDGWLHTGDIGYYDTKHNFYIVDRLKELIKVKGYQVAPSELEEVLRSHPEIIDAGVIGIADKRKGESPVGFITVREGSRVSDIEVRAFLEKKLAPYKQIDRFVFTKTIPKSPAGKILRNQLKNMYQTKYS